MYNVNGQTVLEEKYDENYEPTEEGAYCVFVNYVLSQYCVLKCFFITIYD